MKSVSVRFLALGAIAGFVIAASGCIFVTSRKSGYEEVELTKARAQCLSARVDLERINLEREKAGLPRVNTSAVSGGASPHIEPPIPAPPGQ
ncbi:MAG: hypothetical protein H7210_07395 [Pyrinomonadaceae bacterium]|nr:hypothetical protein [Phycisphaerales bacterium]